MSATELLRLPRIGRRTLHVWRRDARVWTKYAKASLVGHLGEPLLSLVALGFGLGAFVGEIGGVPYFEFLGTGLVCSTMLNGATFECTYSSYTRMTQQRTFEAISVTPVDLDEVVAGEILWAASKGLIGTLFMLVLLAGLGAIHSPGVLLVPPLVFAAGLAFGAMAMLVTAVSPSYDFFSYYFTLGITPMILFSGVFFPVESLHPGVRVFAEVLPLTHVVRIVRPLILGGPIPYPVLDLAYVVITGALAFVIASNLIRRRIRV